MPSSTRVHESTRLAVGLLIFLVLAVTVPISASSPTPYADLGIIEASVILGYYCASFWWGWVTLRRIFPRWGRFRLYAASGAPGSLMVAISIKWILIAIVCNIVGLVSQPIEIILCIRRIMSENDQLQNSVDLRGSQGVQVGGSNTQSNTFTTPILKSTPTPPPPTEPPPSLS
jgi:hypothetical protein